MTSTWTWVDAISVLVLVISVAVAAGYWWYRVELWLEARAYSTTTAHTLTSDPTANRAPDVGIDAAGDLAPVVDLAAARRQRAMRAVS